MTMKNWKLSLSQALAFTRKRTDAKTPYTAFQ